MWCGVMWCVHNLVWRGVVQLVWVVWCSVVWCGVVVCGVCNLMWRVVWCGVVCPSAWFSVLANLKCGTFISSVFSSLVHNHRHVRSQVVCASLAQRQCLVFYSLPRHLPFWGELMH